MSVPAVELSTYAFVAASVLPVGVASPVIFWLLIVISPVELIFNAPGELILPNAPLPVTLRDPKVPILVNPLAVVTLSPNFVFDNTCAFSILYSFPCIKSIF